MLVKFDKENNQKMNSGEDICTTENLSLDEILNYVTVMNRDDKVRFTISDRLDNISALLWNSKYRRINADGLFHLYAQKPLDSLRNQSAIIVSTHIDCEHNITRCFSEKIDNDMLLGTYDNAITNTAALSIMINDNLPDNVIFAFTGDEEYGSTGATQLVEYLNNNKIDVLHIFVLDVTDMAWDIEADYTIENDLWEEETGKKIIKIAESLPYKWRFVPSEPDNIPEYIKPSVTIYQEAAEDESWDYDEHNFSSCSFCLPTFGDMHSNNGIKARYSAFEKYTDTLKELLINLM